MYNKICVEISTTTDSFFLFQRRNFDRPWSDIFLLDIFTLKIRTKKVLHVTLDFYLKQCWWVLRVRLCIMVLFSTPIFFIFYTSHHLLFLSSNNSTLIQLLLTTIVLFNKIQHHTPPLLIRIPIFIYVFFIIY
jgi:hypothetical protein